MTSRVTSRWLRRREDSRVQASGPDQTRSHSISLFDHRPLLLLSCLSLLTRGFLLSALDGSLRFSLFDNRPLLLSCLSLLTPGFLLSAPNTSLLRYLQASVSGLLLSNGSLGGLALRRAFFRLSLLVLGLLARLLRLPSSFLPYSFLLSADTRLLLHLLLLPGPLLLSLN